MRGVPDGVWVSGMRRPERETDRFAMAHSVDSAKRFTGCRRMRHTVSLTGEMLGAHLSKARHGLAPFARSGAAVEHVVVIDQHRRGRKPGR